MIFELQFENILKDFYEYDFFFSQKDFLYFCDSTDEKKRLLILFEKDPRFINVYPDNQINKKYLSKKSLFKHYCNISIRLASQKIFRINQQQLNYLFSFLYKKKRVSYLPSEVFSFGKDHGFVEKIEYSSTQYIFPIAYILSFIHKENFNLAINKIIEKILYTHDIKIINFFNLSQEFFNEGFDYLRDRESYIIKSREGLFDGQRKTLNEIGNIQGITRERVRQIEKRAWKRLKYLNISHLFSSGLICYIINKKGSVLFAENTLESCMMKFLAKCINLPVTVFKRIKKIILGDISQDVDINKIQITDYVEQRQILNWLRTKNNIYLNKKDLQELSRSIADYCKTELTKEQKVYVALKKIGKPAHSLRITEMFNSMFPDSPSTEHNVHAVLSQENNGIVWIGIRSTFALEEWGYEHPSLTLFDTVKTIVKNKYEKTNQPVPFNIIVSEMGKYRRIVNRNSLVIASHCNPDLQRIGENSFIPKDNIEAIQEDDNFKDKLDRVLKEMEE
jgi:hypothetical protein